MCRLAMKQRAAAPGEGIHLLNVWLVLDSTFGSPLRKLISRLAPLNVRARLFVRFRLQASGKLALAEPNRNVPYFDNTVFSVLSFARPDGAARRQQVCNSHTGAGRMHPSCSRRPRRAGHRADRNRQDARFPHPDHRDDAEGRRQGSTRSYCSAHARAGHAGGAGLSRRSHQLRSNPWPWWSAGWPSERSSTPFAAARALSSPLPDAWRTTSSASWSASTE